MKLLFACTLLLLCKAGFAADLTLKITSLNKDSLYIYIVTDEATGKMQKFVIAKKKGVFKFSYTNDTARVVRISDGSNFIYGVAEAADAVTIEYDALAIGSTFIIKGNGSHKYFPDQRKQLGLRLKAQYAGLDTADKEAYLKRFAAFENKIMDSVTALHAPEAASFFLVKGYYKSFFNYSKRRLFGQLYTDMPLVTIHTSDRLSLYVRKQAAELVSFDNDLYNSPDYINDTYYCLLQEYMLQKLLKQANGDIADKYAFYIKHLPQFQLKERVLCLLLETDFKSLNDTEFLSGVVKREYPGTTIYSKHLTALADQYGSLFRKGEKAPAFSLTDVEGNTVSLNSLAGKVVVMDFWFAKCVPCLALFEAMQPLKEKLAAKPVVFLTISIDEKEQWLQSIKKLNLKGLQVYTQDKRDEHPVIADYRVNGYPTVCLLDKNGRFFNASPPVGNMDALLEQIEMALAL